MSPGDLAMGFVILLSVFAVVAAVRAIVSWLHSYPDARLHRDAVRFQRATLASAIVGLSGTPLMPSSPEDCQWLHREHEQDQRQAMLDATQRVLGRLLP